MQSEKFDVIIVGAGPSGSSAAIVAARAGLKVLLLERGEYPGSKNVSGAAFYGTAVLDEILPGWCDQAPFERFITRRSLYFVSPETVFGMDFSTVNYSKPPYKGVIILRPKFDRWLAKQAQAAGAFLLNQVVVDDLLWDNGQVTGVKTRKESGEIHANLVIACDGVNSFLAKKAGLQREFKPEEFSLCVKEVISLDEDLIRERFHLQGIEGAALEYIGAITRDVHGGGFIYTNRDSLSVGVIGQISSLVKQRERPYDLLESFKAHPSVSPLLRGGQPREYSAHIIPEAGWSIMPKLYTSGLLVAGDAAGLCLVAGLYLEGINYAIHSGIAAGETAVKATKDGNFSSNSLSNYERQLKARNVLKDFRSFRTAPHFVNSESVQNLYPLVITSAAEQLFSPLGEPKQKLIPLALKTLRRWRISPWQFLRDGYNFWRALGW